MNAFSVSVVANAASIETHESDAAEMVRRIRSDEWREEIEIIRRTYEKVLSETGDLNAAKRAIDQLKKKLPGVLWSGKFSSRKKPALEKLIQHSGLLCADLDNLGERLAGVRAKLQTSPHQVTVFRSPSDGLKAVFRVPADAEKHAASFLAVEKHVLELTGEKIDGACKDIARLCFASYDPDAPLNLDAVELAPLVETTKPASAEAICSTAPELETRRRIAFEIIGPIEWTTDERGFCTCPGQSRHTTSNSQRDCEIYIEKVPTIHCLHNSCAGIVAGVNHELRSRIRKTEHASGAHTADGEPTSEDEKELQRLAALRPLEYERERNAAAERLQCRTSVLDEQVSARRAWTGADDSTLQGREVLLPDIEPWQESVNGAEVLGETASAFARYIALPDGAADALALWTTHAHCFDVFQCSPRLNISSPEKGCGKTTLRDVLALLVPRPLATENLRVAVLFRVIEARKPTILADEYDAWLRDNEELRGLLNSGHRRGGQALRCEGDGHEVRAFNVYAPAVLCGIGALPGTLHDRSIIIRLERAKPGELHERFDSRHTEREQELCRKLARFCADNRARLKSCDPTLPSGAFNRIADNWRPLFAIAEIAGGDWPQRAAAAFAKLTSRDDADAQGLGAMLLADVRRVFSESGNERMFSSVLVESLCAKSDRPWPEANKGQAITENWLARRLHSFGVHPKSLRIGDSRLKGYEAADFSEAFERYLPGQVELRRDSVTTQAGSRESESSNRDTQQPCHGSKTDETIADTDLSRCHASISTTNESELML